VADLFLARAEGSRGTPWPVLGSIAIPDGAWRASLAQHPAVSQGKINEEHDGEEDPAGGDMEARNDFRESVIPKHNEGSDSDGVAEEHGKETGAVKRTGPALPEAIPIENRHDTKKVSKSSRPLIQNTPERW